MLDQHDTGLVVFLAAGGGCSLDSSPKKNWVENAGGLPNYICKIAKAVMRGGKSKSQAIAIAVSRVKRWAGGGDDVDADTRAKAAKAVAQWNALKAKNKAKGLVKATRPHDDAEYLLLSNIGSFNTDMVRRAWDSHERDLRRAYEAANPRPVNTEGMDAVPESYYPYRWVRELWTDYIIVEVDGGSTFQRIPYTVVGNTVAFGQPEAVEQVWQQAEELDEDDINEIERALLKDVLVLSAPQRSYLDTIRSLADPK